LLTKENSIKTLALTKKLVIDYKASLLKALKGKTDKNNFFKVKTVVFIKKRDRLQGFADRGEQKVH